MASPQCPKFDVCNAPLCPMDEESLSHGIWYPDEEICKRKAFANMDWIKRQKKIAKKAKRMDRYFTFEMLKRNCVITKGIEGLDPDKPEEPQLKKWFKKHPEKKIRKVSEEQKKLGAEVLRKYRTKTVSDSI